MSGTPTWQTTTREDDRLADDAHAGHMARFAAGSATVATFAFSGLASRRRIYVPLATTTAAGALSAADKAALDAIAAALGAFSGTVAGANVAVAATTVTTLASLTLGAGSYLLWGWANVLMGAGAGVADLYLRDGVTQLSGTVATLTIAAAGQEGATTPPYLVAPVGSTTYNLTCFSSAACTGRALGGGAGGFNNMLGIRAVRLR